MNEMHLSFRQTNRKGYLLHFREYLQTKQKISKGKAFMYPQLAWSIHPDASNSGLECQALGSHQKKKKKRQIIPTAKESPHKKGKEESPDNSLKLSS